MTGGLYDAETLERWGVVNRVVADGDRAREGDAVRPAARSGADHGARGDEADRPGRISTAASSAPTRSRPAQFAGLFATEDLQNAVRSFLADGPGKATFEGAS